MFKLESDTRLVLKSMPPAFQMHLLGVRIIEATFTELAVEADDFAFIVSDLKNIWHVNVFLTCIRCLKLKF